jgi:hypothetical protein
MTAIVCANWVLPHPTWCQSRPTASSWAALTELAINLVDAHCLEAADLMSVTATESRMLTVYPFKQASSCLLPVEILMQRLRIWASSAAVMKPLVVGCSKSNLEINGANSFNGLQIISWQLP